MDHVLIPYSQANLPADMPDRQHYIAKQLQELVDLSHGSATAGEGG